MKKTINKVKDYIAPFLVWYWERYESREYEEETNDLFRALSIAEQIVEEGGYAEIVDGLGKEIPLFETWEN